ncbi:MAG TPA: hypothetical protein VLJ59_16450 [Mycobacteriales bacterium]|nr:hypothetical protein [Mycobacteriales bacterium]
MRPAVAERDITRLYRLLQTHGYTQQHIAALTGQSQPEVSAIIHGRQVQAYDVIARIIDGLGAPRGMAGLSYTTSHSPQPPRPAIEHAARSCRLP